MNNDVNTDNKIEELSKVEELAETIKNDCLNLLKDYKNGQIEKEKFLSNIIDSELILENLETIWKTDLKEKYIQVIKDIKNSLYE